MKKNIRKSIAIILIAVFTSISSINYVSADMGLIYENSTTETITSGAILKNVTRFTNDGWVNFNVLTVDLFNPNINVDTLSNTQSISKLTTTKDLAASRGAVAAINTGFFVWSNKTGIGYPIGDTIESGKVVSISPDFDLNQNKNKFATLSISNLNEMLYEYWTTDITLVSPTGATLPVGRYNKFYSGHRDLSIFDRRWSDQTLGTTSGPSDIVEMIVDNGVVTEIREAQPATQIPVNGYVVITRKEGGQQLSSNFKVGDPVALSIKTAPDWGTLKTSVTGGAILIKNGQIPATFSHIPEGKISTRNPRTAIGSTKDGKKLLLVTVDGRQSGSLGMTLTELAKLMQELGAVNAMNLDGGGSTTMVARSQSSQTLDIINNPSDGAGRKISTALGVFSVAPPSALNGLIINAESEDVFVNTSITFTVQGFDRYYNPIEVDPSKIKWGVTGITGTFKDSTFYPTSIGSGVITATYGGITQKYPISSLSGPVQLIIDRNVIKIPLNETFTPSITGKNKNGYYANISPADITWKVPGNLGTFENGTFTAKSAGSGFIEGTIGDIHIYLAISVQEEKKTILDDFETAKASYTSYPANIQGLFDLTNEQKQSGQFSGRLVYNFDTIDGTRASYITYPGEGLPLDKNTTKLGLWVYLSIPNPSWLAATVKDAKGLTHSVYFTKTMDWAGWSYVEASTTFFDSPALLQKLYVVQTNPVVDSGTILIDDLCSVTSSFPSIDMKSMPKDTVPDDDANKAVSYRSSSSSLRFSVFGQSAGAYDDYQKTLYKKLTAKLKNNFDAAAFVGSSKENPAAGYKKPALATNFGYKSIDLKGNTFIQLDTKKNGLRMTDVKEWKWLFDTLDKTKSNNVFIFLAGPPSSFSDEQEGDLFKEVLRQYKKKTHKNIWVFYKGKKNESIMINGIKYISNAGFDVDGLNSKTTNLAKYTLVTVKGTTITYEFRPIN